MARGRMRAVINSFKNVIDTSGSLTGASVSVTILAVAVQPGNLDTLSNQVPIGGKISAIYYSLYIFSDATEVQNSLVDIYWWKRQEGSLSIPIPGAVGISQSKRWVFHEEKGLSGNRTTGTPMVIKGVLKIPKPYQRFGNGDELQMRILAPIAGFFCAKHIYRVVY